MKNPLIRMALGASVPHKKATENMQTEAMPIPAKIYLPMSMHIGAACVPCVQKGDKVFVGSLVGKAENFVSSNIYSSVSGTVEGVTTLMQDNGQLAETVVIESDGFATADEDIKPPVVTDRETFIKAIRESGLVGLGGAGFPTFIKLSPTNIDKIDTLIINGAECEPYITADNREFIECSEDVLAGIELCKTYLGIKKVIIGIERNKPKAIDVMFSLTQGDKTLKVKPLKSHYPQGAEKIIIETLTGKKVPQGGLPSDVGVIVLNVATVSFISKYIKTGMPLVTKRLTVDGDAVANPKNVLARIGTPIGDVLDFCGGFSKPAVKVIMGGPMMGRALYDDDKGII
ncbi:MAG: RnfABCDGE type electron transport complex subunit C, partial [Oscillospiraceae bacterium]